MTELRAIKPRELGYGEWMASAEEEYRRLATLLGMLAPEEWSRPTDCTEWDVRAMVGHLAGAAASMASPRETVHQLRSARRLHRPGDFVDAINEVQVTESAGLDQAELRRRLSDRGAHAVAARRRLPAVVRAIPLPLGPPLGVKPLGYLMGRIYTRDAWLHRVDITRATGRDLVLTAAHDGRIVEDVVAEWAQRHGSAYALRLTGPAGGSWRHGEGGPELSLDAVEFCRVVSGRAPGTGLLATPVPF